MRHKQQMLEKAQKLTGDLRGKIVTLLENDAVLPALLVNSSRLSKTV